MAKDQPWAGSGIEPSMAELLADPVVRAVLRYDGLTPGQVWSVVREARKRMALGAACRSTRA